MKAFWELYVAGVKEIVRDGTALFWTIVFPVMFILIFGVIFSGGEDVSFSVGLVNEDGEDSAALVAAFKEVSAFELSEGSRQNELDALKNGDRRGVIVIPKGTGAAINQTLSAYFSQQGEMQSVPLEVYYDPSNQNTAQIVLTVVDKVVGNMGQNMTRTAPVFRVEAQSVSSQELRNIDYLLPGVISMSIMQTGLMATAGPLVSMRVRKVFKRISATPVARWKVMASYIILRMTIAVFQTWIIIGVGVAVFKVHIETQNIPAMLGMVLLGSLMFISLGYFLSTLANTEEAVIGISQLPNMVFMFLSGIFFPLDFMPDWIRPLVDMIPLTYLGDALRQLMVGAGATFTLTTSIGMLAGWLVVCLLLSLRFFRWE